MNKSVFSGSTLNLKVIKLPHYKICKDGSSDCVSNEDAPALESKSSKDIYRFDLDDKEVNCKQITVWRPAFKRT